MIPFSPTTSLAILMVLVIGSFCTLALLLWWLRLALSPPARQRFANHRISRSVLMAFLVVGLAWSADRFLTVMHLQQEIEAQIIREEAERTPTMTQDTVLAGISMPAGTRLELLFLNAVGKQWVKPEYFEIADFPRPIEWQGVSIKRLHRRLQSHQDNSPESFRTTRVAWGRYLETELAVPQTVNGFYCTKTVEWIYDGKTGNWDYDNDAAQAGPVYRFERCH